MTMYLPKVGDRVVVKDEWLEGTGTIFFIDEPKLYVHYEHPIQVEFDEPYDDGEQRMYRCSMLEIAPLEVS